MRSRFLFVFVASALVFVAHIGAEEQKFEAGAFSIVAPVELKEQTKSIDTKHGKIELHMFAGEKDGWAYAVSYSDYPADLVKQGPEPLLDAARNGAAESIKGKVASETKISLEGNAGRELDLEGKVEEKVSKRKARIYLVGTRLYQIMIVNQDGKETPEAVARYLNSFQLLKK